MSPTRIGRTSFLTLAAFVLQIKSQGIGTRAGPDLIYLGTIPNVREDYLFHLQNERHCGGSLRQL